MAHRNHHVIRAGGGAGQCIYALCLSGIDISIDLTQKFFAGNFVGGQTGFAGSCLLLGLNRSGGAGRNRRFGKCYWLGRRNRFVCCSPGRVNLRSRHLYGHTLRSGRACRSTMVCRNCIACGLDVGVGWAGFLDHEVTPDWLINVETGIRLI
jgi:hypothetical protein